MTGHLRWFDWIVCGLVAMVLAACFLYVAVPRPTGPVYPVPVRGCAYWSGDAGVACAGPIVRGTYVP